MKTMKNKLTNKEIAALLPHIKAVLKTGKAWEDKALHHPAGAIIDAVLTIKGMAKDDSVDTRGSDGFDTNGWEYDWWQHFTHDGRRYTLSGSGYYGGHAFHLTE